MTPIIKWIIINGKPSTQSLECSVPVAKSICYLFLLLALFLETFFAALFFAAFLFFAISLLLMIGLPTTKPIFIFENFTPCF
ncbi:MAG: hypothetical protein AUJ39_01860 [Parcubacteria group bacterium CG1_02_42_13]|nr:MAG: hypothetical protein AUJ39_01860 [Parcubacteria group bacterium CG1_02_42_13]